MLFEIHPVTYGLKLPNNAVRSSTFFFSSRRRHTRSDRDWSSDVCSSDLTGGNSTDIFHAGSIGGLVGMQDAGGSIIGGVASGNVSGGSNTAVGGLVGFN